MQSNNRYMVLANQQPQMQAQRAMVTRNFALQQQFARKNMVFAETGKKVSAEKASEQKVKEVEKEIHGLYNFVKENKREIVVAAAGVAALKVFDQLTKEENK